MKKSLAYVKLAEIYDHVMRKVNYSDWADYIFTITENYVGDNPKVLEFAAGNCKLANYLSEYFPDITITDYSRSMLFSDKQKKLPKVCCDMSLIPFKTKFDLVYSTFDSVNYLISKKKLLDHFLEVNRILSEKGIYTFDASLERNSFVHIKQPVRMGKYKNINYFHKTEYDKNKKIHKNIFEIKFDDGKVFKEIHKQKIYPFEEYFKLIEKAGMYVIHCLEAFTLNDAEANSLRAQFILGRSGITLN